MIVKILGNGSAGFAGVTYNTSKVDRNKGELLLAANFGALDGLTALRPQDYINYLQFVSSANSRVANPQFHAVLSARDRSYSREELLDTAVKWLTEMGYGGQPYLVVFHKDTANNHVHVVTTRIGRDGRKISSAYEKLRAVKALDKVLGYELAQTYRVSTAAQFYLILERQGYFGKDFSERKLQDLINRYEPEKARSKVLRELFVAHQSRPDFVQIMREKHVDIVFHAVENKPAYGYTVIDHETRQVFKGSQIMPLKQLLAESSFPTSAFVPAYLNEQLETQPDVYIPPVLISDDIDDEAILGRNRRRKRKARTNTR